jgi:hypothetical protein
MAVCCLCRDHVLSNRKVRFTFVAKFNQARSLLTQLVGQVCSGWALDWRSPGLNRWRHFFTHLLWAVFPVPSTQCDITKSEWHYQLFRSRPLIRNAHAPNGFEFSPEHCKMHRAELWSWLVWRKAMRHLPASRLTAYIYYKASPGEKSWNLDEMFLVPSLGWNSEISSKSHIPILSKACHFLSWFSEAFLLSDVITSGIREKFLEIVLIICVKSSCVAVQ